MRVRSGFIARAVASSNRAIGAVVVCAVACAASACGGDEPRSVTGPSPVPGAAPPPAPGPAPAPAPPTPAVPTLAIAGPPTLTRGQTIRYTATLRLVDGTTQDQTDAAEWTTSDAGRASVSPGGRVTGRQEGEVEIRASFQGASGRLDVSVVAPTLRLSGRAELTRRADTSQLLLTATRADGSREDVAPAAAQWTSSNPAVASVSGSGLVTAAANGRTEIVARYEGASTALPVVVNIPPPRLVIDAPAGNPTSLTVTFEWRLLDGDPARTYQYQVRLDKGVDACDSGIEEAFNAGAATRLTVTLETSRYRGQSVDFAIRLDDGAGLTLCERGRRFTLP
jgi:hypothetical protein